MEHYFSPNNLSLVPPESLVSIRNDLDWAWKQGERVWIKTVKQSHHQAGSNDDKKWGSKISLDCPFKRVKLCLLQLITHSYEDTKKLQGSVTNMGNTIFFFTTSHFLLKKLSILTSRGLQNYFLLEDFFVLFFTNKSMI